MYNLGKYLLISCEINVAAVNVVKSAIFLY